MKRSKKLSSATVPGDLQYRPGSQFISSDFVDLLWTHGIQQSMDGKDRWVDNVIVERLWKSVKSEEIYLHAYDSVAQAKHGRLCRHFLRNLAGLQVSLRSKKLATRLERYFRFYNERRPHSSLDDKTPDQVYFNSLSSQSAA